MQVIFFYVHTSFLFMFVSAESILFALTTLAIIFLKKRGVHGLRDAQVQPNFRVGQVAIRRDEAYQGPSPLI